MSAPVFGHDTTALEVIADHDLTGKEAVVTGGASGLGYETARALATAGARVVVAGRDRAKGEAATQTLRADSGNQRVVYRHLDLASLRSVSTWARRHSATGKPLDILVLNAGVMAPPLTRTVDGFETQFAINYLGHLVFTLGLLPSLRAAGTARVVSLSSRGHRRGDVDFDDPNYRHRPYDAWEAYGQSKTACALFAVGLTARYSNEGITSNTVAPGAIKTGLQRHMSQEEIVTRGWDVAVPRGWKTLEQGAATTIWAAVAPELDGVGGKYLDDCAIAQPWTHDDSPPDGHYFPYALDSDHADRLWSLSERLIEAAGEQGGG
jgi:NAD(P)-dependent dehydrogenase (short-subunit alcohol dehydrogenase family)